MKLGNKAGTPIEDDFRFYMVCISLILAPFAGGSLVSSRLMYPIPFVDILHQESRQDVGASFSHDFFSEISFRSLVISSRFSPGVGGGG